MSKIDLVRFENMHPHEQRAVVEFRYLEESRKRLLAFLQTQTADDLQDDEKELLNEQAYHMRCYSSILVRRIAKFL